MANDTDEKVNIYPVVNDKGESVLIIRKGEAEKIVPPQRVEISGTIQTPADWLADHTTANTGSAYVTVNLEKRTICYRSFPEYAFGAIITGFLKESNQLNRLGINHGHKYNAASLAKHLKTVTSLATSKADILQVIGRLETLKLKVNKEVEKLKDEKGNQKLDYNQIVESNLIFELSFKVPIFEREEAQTVAALIVIEEVSQHDVVLTLQNYDLPDEMDTKALEYLNREVKRFTDMKDAGATVTVVWQN